MTDHVSFRKQTRLDDAHLKEIITDYFNRQGVEIHAVHFMNFNGAQAIIVHDQPVTLPEVL